MEDSASVLDQIVSGNQIFGVIVSDFFVVTIQRTATQLRMLSEWSPEVVSVRAILLKGHRPKRYKVLRDSRIFTGCPNPVKIM